MRERLRRRLRLILARSGHLDALEPYLEDAEERAAIQEVDGGMTRAEAEASAMAAMLARAKGNSDGSE